MKSLLTILICCLTFSAYSQSKIILMPEANFEKSGEKHSSFAMSGGRIQLNLKGGYKIFPQLYAGPSLGYAFNTSKNKDNSEKRTQTFKSAGIFIGYFQKHFQEKKVSFNAISQFLYEKSNEKNIKSNWSSDRSYQTYRIELIPSLHIKCTSRFGINIGVNFYYEQPKKNSPNYISKNYGLYPNIGFIIPLL